MLYLCLTLMNLLLRVVLHSSSLVTMAVPIPRWDVTSDFLFPPDMLAVRTAGPKWNHAKLYGSFAALWEDLALTQRTYLSLIWTLHAQP